MGCGLTEGCDLLAWSISRRHLSAVQKAFVADSVRAYHDQLARERKREAGEVHGAGKVPVKLPGPIRADTRATARELLVELLTVGEDGAYPWQRVFYHDSFPDRAWGPYKTLPDYLANRNPEGPGPAWSRMTVADFRDWFHADVQVCDLLDRAMQREASPGTNQYTDRSVNNINEPQRPTGTSQAQALRRLRKECPELHARVVAGELTAHAAALQAGFRRPYRSVPVDSPQAALRALLTVFTSDELATALRCLM